MGKKVVVIISCIIVFVIFLLITELLSVNKLCGFEYGYMAKRAGKVGKAWTCKCIGLKSNISSSYTIEDYCTGINISNNKLNKVLYKDLQYPVSLE